MKESKADRKWQTITAILCLPVFYFLSYGPMNAFYYEWGLYGFDVLYVDYWYEPFYDPIDWLWMNTPLDVPIEWYEDLWVSILPAP